MRLHQAKLLNYLSYCSGKYSSIKILSIPVNDDPCFFKQVCLNVSFCLSTPLLVFMLTIKRSLRNHAQRYKYINCIIRFYVLLSAQLYTVKAKIQLHCRLFKITLKLYYLNQRQPLFFKPGNHIYLSSFPILGIP